MKKALDGIRVLEWAAWLNGPSAGYMLGDLGAEVIKIEDPVHGDPLRGLAAQYGRPGGLPGERVLGFETANRNKRGITLNVKHPKGKELLYKLVQKCDVFITSYNESLARRLALDYDSLKKHNSRIIYAHGTGWGLQGPRAEQSSFDLLIQGPSGLMWNVGDRASPEPSSIVGGVVDIAGGTMLAYGILAALVARERHGVGQEIASGLLGAAMHFQAMNVNATLWTGRPVLRNSRVKVRNALTTYYRCADGKWLILCAIQFQRHWGEFCAATGLDPHVADGGKEGKELVAVLDKVFAVKTREEWLRIFEQRKCSFPYAAINALPEVVNDPQVIENNYVIPFAHPTIGNTRTIGFPVWFSETPCDIQRPAPEFGQHTEEVLQELAGLSWDDISHLRDEGVV